MTTLTRLDLNLLVSLLALLEERNVTRAGQRLHVSQPAMSSALARLRRHFKDELLGRAENEYVLTPLAEGLLPELREVMRRTERIVAMRWEFHPQTSHRRFSLMLSDYAQLVLARPLAAVVTQRAPRCYLDFRGLPDTPVTDVEAILRQLDLAVLPHGFRSGYPSVDLFSDTWCALVSADNSDIGDRATVAELATYPQVALTIAGEDQTPAAQRPAMNHAEPWVQARTNQFLTLPFLVEGTNRVALVQRRLAARLCAAADVRVIELVGGAGPFTEAAWWHPVHEADPAHVWLRSLLTEVAADLTTS